MRPHAAGCRRSPRSPAGSLVTIDGGGHGPHASRSRHRQPPDPGVRRHVHRLPRTRTWVRAARRPKRALYISSPIGLGHALRDVAIAAELRQHHPDLQIDWLAQHPVTKVLEDRGERVHPASAWLANESAHVEDESAEHDLHAFQAIRRMDEILVNNFMVFNDVVNDEHYDLVIGDEAWDVDYFLHENPELKHFEFAWMTDFVGWLPMPDGGDRRGGADRRLQRRDDRAAGPLPAAARPLDLRRRPRRHRPRLVRTRPAGDPRVDRGELRVRRLRHRLRPGRVRRPRGAARRARLSPRRAGVPRHRRRLRRRRGLCCAGSSTPMPGRPPARRRPALRRRLPGRGSTRARCPGARVCPTAATSRSSTATSRPATSPSCRAG